jgi:tetratricopeptide (TPR) repeat protein
MTEWPEMSRKHFAIAKAKRMRDVGMLPPKSSIPKNFRTQAREFKVEVVDYKKLKTMDENLSAKESDLLFFDLIDFLLSRTVFGVADIALEYIQDKSTQRYLMAEARVCVLQTRYAEAASSLDKLLSVNPNEQQAWILRGHAFFFLENLFDSEECYINALRIKPAPTDECL